MNKRGLKADLAELSDAVLADLSPDDRFRPTLIANAKGQDEVWRVYDIDPADDDHHTTTRYTTRIRLADRLAYARSLPNWRR